MKTISTIFIVMLAVALSANAQIKKFNRIVTMQVQTTRVDTSGIPDLSDTTALFSAKIKAFLMDTTGISKLSVTLKRSKESAALLQHDFDFDAAPGSGFTYNRNKHTVELGLGNYTGLLHLYAEIKVQKTDGSFSDPITFTR